MVLLPSHGPISFPPLHSCEPSPLPHLPGSPFLFRHHTAPPAHVIAADSPSSPSLILLFASLLFPCSPLYPVSPLPPNAPWSLSVIPTTLPGPRSTAPGPWSLGHCTESLVPGPLHPVPGPQALVQECSRSLVPGPLHLVPGPWSTAPSPWSPVHCTRYLGPGPLHPSSWSLVPGPLHQVPGPRATAPGPWSLVHCTKSLIHCTRYLGRGSLHQVPGLWSTAPGPCCAFSNLLPTLYPVSFAWSRDRNRGLWAPARPWPTSSQLWHKCCHTAPWRLPVWPILGEVLHPGCKF